MNVLPGSIGTTLAIMDDDDSMFDALVSQIPESTWQELMSQGPVQPSSANDAVPMQIDGGREQLEAELAELRAKVRRYEAEEERLKEKREMDERSARMDDFGHRWNGNAPEIVSSPLAAAAGGVKRKEPASVLPSRRQTAQQQQQPPGQSPQRDDRVLMMIPDTPTAGRQNHVKHPPLVHPQQQHQPLRPRMRQLDDYDPATSKPNALAVELWKVPAPAGTSFGFALGALLEPPPPSSSYSGETVRAALDQLRYCSTMASAVTCFHSVMTSLLSQAEHYVSATPPQWTNLVCALVVLDRLVLLSPDVRLTFAQLGGPAIQPALGKVVSTLLEATPLASAKQMHEATWHQACPLLLRIDKTGPTPLILVASLEKYLKTCLGKVAEHPKDQFPGVVLTLNTVAFLARQRLLDDGSLKSIAEDLASLVAVTTKDESTEFVDCKIAALSALGMLALRSGNALVEAFVQLPTKLDGVATSLIPYGDRLSDASMPRPKRLQIIEFLKHCTHFFFLLYSTTPSATTRLLASAPSVQMSLFTVLTRAATDRAVEEMAADVLRRMGVDDTDINYTDR